MTATIRTIQKRYYREVITAAIIFAVVFAFMGVNIAHGALFTGERTLITSSIGSTNSNQEHRIVIPAAWASGRTFILTLGANFTTDGAGQVLNETDFDLAWRSAAAGTITEAYLQDTGTATASSWGLNVVSNTRFDFVVPGDAISIPPINSTVYIEIGGNATFDGTGNTSIINPALDGTPGVADIISIDFDYNGAVDTGRSMIALIEGIAVSATVAESLSASIAGTAAATCDTEFDDFAGDNNVAPSATTVPFGTVSVDEFYHGCQDIGVITNAANGWSATAEANSQLYFASGNTIPGFAFDSGGVPANPTTAGVWGTSNTYAFGYSCGDTVGTVCTPDFIQGGVSEYRPFADRSLATPEAAAVFASNTAAGNNTLHIDYRLKVATTQTVGTYNNIITYIITPTF